MCSKGTAVQRVWANSWVDDVQYSQAIHFEAAVIAGLVSTKIDEHSPERLLLVALRAKKWGVLIESANGHAESTIPASTNARQQKSEKGCVTKTSTRALSQALRHWRVDRLCLLTSFAEVAANVVIDAVRCGVRLAVEPLFSFEHHDSLYSNAIKYRAASDRWVSGNAYFINCAGVRQSIALSKCQPGAAHPVARHKYGSGFR